MFSPIKFVFTQIMELANEAPRAYTPSRLAVKSSQPHDNMAFGHSACLWCGERAKPNIPFELTKVYIISYPTKFLFTYFVKDGAVEQSGTR